MNKLGIVVFGETDHVSYCNTFEEAQALAKQGAKYIRDNLKAPSHPVSFVGLMLDDNWMDQATEHEKGIAGGQITGTPQSYRGCRVRGVKNILQL